VDLELDVDDGSGADRSDRHADIEPIVDMDVDRSHHTGVDGDGHDGRVTPAAERAVDLDLGLDATRRHDDGVDVQPAVQLLVGVDLVVDVPCLDAQRPAAG
jgi:hypothetical protein